jgi:hypothetical protein
MSKINKKGKGLYLSFVALRIITPLFIFNNPIFIIVLNFLLDTFDAEAASMNFLSVKQYEVFDKTLDLWWFLILFWFALSKFPEYSLLLSILLVYRLIGEVLFIVFKRRKILFIFPNFFEFTFYLIFFSKIFDKLHFLIEGNNFIVSLVIIFIIKLIQEYLLHVKEFSLRENFLHLKRNWRK